MCTCWGDQGRSLYRLISLRNVSPSRTSISSLRGTNGRRHWSCAVKFLELLAKAFFLKQWNKQLNMCLSNSNW